MMRRVAALVGQWIAACEGVNAKTPHPDPSREQRCGAVAIHMGRGLGGQHWGLHPVVRGSIPRRSISLANILTSLQENCNEYFK